MNIEDRLKDIIESKFENVKVFSEEIGLPYTTVRSILQRGLLNSKVENVIKIADGLNMKAEDLIREKSVDKENIIILYDKLEEKRQRKVYDFAEKQLEDQNKKRTIRVIGQTAAGEPLMYGDGFMEEKEVMSVPKGAECALYVKGDSMEPQFPDGSIVFYKKQPSVDSGQIAIVEIDGEAVTCKKVLYDYENETIILRSLNDKYDDAVVEADRVKIIGLVVK